MIHLDDAPALSEALREAVRKRAQYALEYRLQHPDGRIRWVHDRGQGVAEDSRAISHIDGVLLEITDRKVAEGTLGELTGRLLQTQDDERRRIARELHDSTSPLLTSLITKLYTLRHRTRDLDATTSKTLDDSLKLADETSSVIRSVSYLLHPRLLDENGLLASLRWYLSGFADRTGIRVEVKFPEEVSGLSREAETTLFRIVQESLTNILRHSGSTVAKVRIAAEKQELTLTVGDEGQGIPPGTLERIRQGAIALGVGIPGMRERMSQLGGRLEINSTGAGTTVRATLPLGETKN